LFCFLSLKGQDNLASKFVGITNTPINDILIERDNNFLIATGNGLYRLQDFDIDAELINNKGIYKLGADQNNLTWLGLYDSQVSSLKKGETFFIGIDENNMITAMLIHENNVWIGTNDGLYMLSLRKVKEMPHYLRENSKLLSNQITALEIDDKGKI
jgi:ligand-binding sensor domain-containing protein